MRFWFVIILVQLVTQQENIQRMMRSLAGGTVLIGPGKAIDTNKYFVICTDNLCNVQVKNPYVITTGPKSINPKLEMNMRWIFRFYIS